MPVAGSHNETAYGKNNVLLNHAWLNSLFTLSRRFKPSAPKSVKYLCYDRVIVTSEPIRGT